MDLVLDKDIRQIMNLEKFYLYLFEKTRSSLEYVYFVVEEEDNAYLINSENDFEALKKYCEVKEKFFPRIVVKNESFPDFRIVQEKGIIYGTLVRLESEFWKEWILQSIGSAKISYIASEQLVNCFSVETIEENIYKVTFRYLVEKRHQEFNFTARPYYEKDSLPVGPDLWVYFRT